MRFLKQMMIIIITRAVMSGYLPPVLHPPVLVHHPPLLVHHLPSDLLSFPLMFSTPCDSYCYLLNIIPSHHPFLGRLWSPPP